MRIEPMFCSTPHCAPLVNQASIWRNYKSAASWQAGAQIDIFRQRPSGQVRIKAQGLNYLSTKTHYATSKLSNLLRSSVPKIIRMPVDGLPIVAESASHEEFFEKTPREWRDTVIRYDSGYPCNYWSICPDNLFDVLRLQNHIVIEKDP
jgi:hypothetical protein